MNNIATYTPQLDLAALDRARLAEGTRRHYKAAILAMFRAGVNVYDLKALAVYTDTLPSSTRSNLKAALNIMSREYINQAKVSNAPVDVIQRFLWFIEVMNDTIQVSQPDAERTPHWLSQEQVDKILSLANSQRDYIVLAVLFGSALRREELSELTFDNVIQIPDKGVMKDYIVIRGKGDKKRYIPISKVLAERLNDWRDYIGGGYVARSIDRHGNMKDSLSPSGIFAIVRRYGSMIGIEDLDPHDARRSYGRLLYEATNDIVKVKNILGHADTKTTLRYIGVNLNFDIDEEDYPVN